MMKNQKRAVCLLACLLIAGFTAAQEKKESAQTASGSKEEGNRNVMLNASSANGPREISIGLLAAEWFADVSGTRAKPRSMCQVFRRTTH